MTYQEEQNKVLELILNTCWFKKWVKINYSHNAPLELFIAQELNDKETILHNIDLLFTYLINKKYLNINTIVLTLENNLFEEDIFKTILKYINKDIQINTIIVNSYNLDFTATREQLINNYVKIFNNINCTLNYKFITNNIVDNKLFDFVKDNNYDFEVNFSVENIDNWVNQLNWWIENCEQKYLSLLEHVYFKEDFSNTWTDSVIERLQELYQINIDYLLQTKEINNITLLDEIFLEHKLGGFNLSLVRNRLDKDIFTYLTINIDTLAVGFRDTIKDTVLNYGKFIVDNDSIIDIEAININFIMKVLTSDLKTSLLNCDICKYNNICCQQRFNICKQRTKDPFIVSLDLCKILKAKYNFLFDEYKKLGLFNIYTETVLKNSEYFNSNYLNICKLQKYIEGEQNGN